MAASKLAILWHKNLENLSRALVPSCRSHLFARWPCTFLSHAGVHPVTWCSSSTSRWSVSYSDKPWVVVCLCGITLAKSLDPASRFRSQLYWLFSRLAQLSLAWSSIPWQHLLPTVSLLGTSGTSDLRYAQVNLQQAALPLLRVNGADWQLLVPACGAPLLNF